MDLDGVPLPPNAPPPGSCVRLERPEQGLVVLVLDPPHRELPVLDAPLLTDLEQAVAQLEMESSLRGLVIRGRAPEVFCAGADIDAIEAIEDPEVVRRLVRGVQDLFHRVHMLSRRRPQPVMTVAAVGGPVLGGAFELALACSRIVLCDDPATRIGLPETMLGILPGWGGCQRLPRRIGVPAALDAILSGKRLPPKLAKKRGFVDRLAKPAYLFDVAARVATGREHLRRRGRGLAGWLIDRNPLATGTIATITRRKVLEKTAGHYPAPLAAIDIVARAPHTSFEAGFEAEADAVAELGTGATCKNLVGVFRMQEAAKRLAKPAEHLPAIARASVLGAGTMGGTIASLLAEKGVATRLFDLAPAALDDALHAHRRHLAKQAQRRRIDPPAERAALDRLDTTRQAVGFARSQLVLEAVAERLDVKKRVFGDLAQDLAPDAILATNTSSLSVSAIADGLPHPERVVGMHFFNPVRAMPLVEVIRGARTSDETVARTARLALRLGKTPVVVADCAGFLVNRLLGPYLDEAVRLFDAGVDPSRLERVAVEFGLPMGPLELLDEVGFDIAIHAAHSLHAAYGERMTPSPALERIAALPAHRAQEPRPDTPSGGGPGSPPPDGAGTGGTSAARSAETSATAARSRDGAPRVSGGSTPPDAGSAPGDGPRRLGKKTGRGFYLHGQGKKRSSKDLVLCSDLEHLQRPDGAAATLDDEELLDRMLLAMANEAARALEEEIVAQPRDLDLATVFGMGFPPFRGGLLRWIDARGAGSVVASLERIADAPDVRERDGGTARFTPAALLRRAAADGTKLRG